MNRALGYVQHRYIMWRFHRAKSIDDLRWVINHVDGCSLRQLAGDDFREDDGVSVSKHGVVTIRRLADV